jgi:hypothetical protein
LADNNLARIQLSTDDDGASSVSEEEEPEWVSYIQNSLVPVTEFLPHMIFPNPTGFWGCRMFLCLFCLGM